MPLAQALRSTYCISDGATIVSHPIVEDAKIMRALPNLRHLRVFHLTMVHNSVNRAAQEAKLSQPAVTQAIANLEDEFGCILFERRSIGMFPTQSGQLLGVRVKRALDFIAEAGQRLGGSTRQPASRVTFERFVSTSQLRALSAIAHTGNFVGAARYLGITPPSVHRAATQLEELVGVPLFERVSQGLVLTRIGRALARSANLAFHEIELATQDIAAANGIIRGRISIGSLPLAQANIVPTALKLVSEKFPHASISVVDGSYEILLEALRNGEIDCLIGALRSPAPAVDVEEEVLFEDQLAVLARSGHPLHGKSAVSIDDLARARWLVPREGSPARELFDELLADTGEAPREEGLIETGSFTVVRAMLLNSDRLALLSVRQAKDEIAEEKIAPLPYAMKELRRAIGVTTRRDYLPTELSSAMLEALRHSAVE